MQQNRTESLLAKTAPPVLRDQDPGENIGVTLLVFVTKFPLQTANLCY